MSKPQMDNLRQFHLYRGGTVDTTTAFARTTETTFARTRTAIATSATPAVATGAFPAGT